jgi:hypothetical protein
MMNTWSILLPASEADDADVGVEIAAEVVAGVVAWADEVVAATVGPVVEAGVTVALVLAATDAPTAPPEPWD